MSNLKASFTAIWNAVDAARDAWVIEQANLLQIFNPEHPTDKTILIIEEIIQAIIGVATFGLGLVGTPAAAGAAALVSAGGGAAITAIDKIDNDDTDPITALADIEK